MDAAHMPLISIARNEGDGRPASPTSSMTQRIMRVAYRCLQSPVTTGMVALGSATVIIASAAALDPVLNRYASNCVNDLNNFSPNLSTCRAPYESTITACQALIGTFCGAAGFLLQQLWEYIPPVPAERQQELSLVDRAKLSVARVQTRHSYEFHLLLGWLYNGLWINTSDVSSWEAYFKLQTAAIGLAGMSLGMFLRIQYQAIKQHLSQVEEYQAIPGDSSFRLKDHWPIIVISSTGATLFIVTFAAPDIFSEREVKITREACMIALGIPLGQLFANAMNGQKDQIRHGLARRVISILNASVRRAPASLVGLGYVVYIANASSQGARLTGMTIMGFAFGVKDAAYRYDDLEGQAPTEEIVVEEGACRRFVQQSVFMTKQYWRTAALVGLAIVMKTTPILRCYDVTNYDCPLAFELSGDYVNIDGDGVNIAIATGLVHYYALKFFQRMRTHPTVCIEAASEKYLYLADKYQFELLSLMPYVVINSGAYIPDFNAYACYNPAPLLVLIGLTMGTYNEKVLSGRNDPFRPAFTDVSAATTSIPL